MGKKLTIEDVERDARALLDAKMASIRHLVTAKEHTETLRDQLAEADRDEHRAYTAALASGWSATELSSLGLKEPTTDRPRRRRTTPAPDAAPVGG